MSTSDRVLSDFIDAWNAGRRPRVGDDLQRVPGDQRDELAEQITPWLELAPPPAYSEQARAAIRSEPIVQGVLSTVGDDAGAWPALLPRLRRRAGMGLGELAGRLVEALRLGEADEARRAAAYLERMERGELGPDRVVAPPPGRARGAAGRQRGVMADLGGLFPAGPPAAPAGGTLFRAEEDAATRWPTTSRCSPVRRWRPHPRRWTSSTASSSAGPAPTVAGR